MKIVECVPNISEGRNKQIIDAVVDAIKNSGPVQVLDVDAGFDTNRTVITFVGSPEAVMDGAYACIKKSFELIDMSKHHGEHPRQGCTDVCPFIPVSDITIDECVELSKKLAKKVSLDFGIPIYLYGYSASSKEREDLAYIRKGEYESLNEKLKTLKPDFGPSEFNETVKRSGAINISARDFLVAFNVNLNTRDKNLAQEIALNIREAGRAKKDTDGKILKDKDGNSIKQKGLLKSVKAIGWYIEEYKVAQISINLTNYKDTPLWKLFETCCGEAEKLGIRVTGSELVGLLPKDCILQCGKYFLSKSKKSVGAPEKELIHIAVKSMGLDELSSFNPDEKIIEYKIQSKLPLNSLSLTNFIDEVASLSPAPGGGTVSALAGSLGAGLGAMVASLTPSKKGFEKTLEELSKTGETLVESLEFLKIAVDKDTDAFNDVMSAMRMPKNTDAEKELRLNAMEEGYKKASMVPFETAEKCFKVLEDLKHVAKLGNPNSASDVGVGALMTYAGFEGAVLNVKINLPNIKDETFKNDLSSKIDKMKSLSIRYKDEILKITEDKIGTL